MRGQLTWLGPPGAPVRFPDPGDALAWPNGLLCAGGDLSPERLLAAYGRGIFPWYEEGQPILWWSPDPRAVILPGEFHVSRRMRRMLRSGRFTASFDRDFGAVVEGCARRNEPGAGTWITDQMAGAYIEMHRLGHAHSVETWCDGELAGGLYGVALGRVFFAESMFSLVSDASKAALAHLWGELTARCFVLMDCQLLSPHLERLGAKHIPRRAFLALLAGAINAEGGPPGAWNTTPTAVHWPPAENHH